MRRFSPGRRHRRFKATYPGTPVAVTEPVADYLLQAMGADIVTPFVFQADIMNGVDPSPEDITQEEGFFTNHQAKVFCYNQQVVDSLTTTIRHTAQSAGVPVVGVYETMPTPGYDYQSWMDGRSRGDPGGRGHGRRRSTCERGARYSRSTGSASPSPAGRILDDVSFEVRAGRVHRASSGPTARARPRCCGSSSAPSEPTPERSGSVARRTASVADPSATSPEGRARSRHADAGPGSGRARTRRASVRHLAVATKEQREAVEQILARCRLPRRFADSRVGSLSGGEQQRVLSPTP